MLGENVNGLDAKCSWTKLVAEGMDRMDGRCNVMNKQQRRCLIGAEKKKKEGELVLSLSEGRTTMQLSPCPAPATFRPRVGHHVSQKPKTGQFQLTVLCKLKKKQQPKNQTNKKGKLKDIEKPPKVRRNETP